MKNMTTINVPMTALALVAAFGITAAQAQDTVRIGTEGAYAPWNYIDDSGNLAGYEVDLGNAICEQAGWTCEFVANEWDSIITNLNAENYDLIMAGMSITDERKESIDFSDEYFPPDPSTYLAETGSEFDFDALSDYKIGVQGATIQADYVNENFSENNTILAYENPDQSVADLLAGNIDILFADGSFIRPVAEGTDLVEVVGPDVLIGGGVGAGMRKNDDELEAAYNEALQVLKDDGTVDALIMEYFERGPFFTEGS